MKSKIISLILLSGLITFSSCKKEKANNNTDNNNTPQGTKDQLFQSFQVMEKAETEMIRIGDSLNLSPPEAMSLTVPYLKSLDGVEDAYLFDSVYLRIKTKGGYWSVLSLNEVGQDGLSVFRGGAKRTTGLSRFGCSNKIENKKVLLFAAYHDDFYKGDAYQTKVVDVIENGDVDDMEVTVLKNGQCTPEIVKTFDQYGLVIIDSHGETDGVNLGIQFKLDASEIPGSVDAFHDLLATKIGSQNLPLLLDKSLSFGRSYEYDPKLQNQQVWDKYKSRRATSYYLKLTSKGIRELVPDLSNTVVFANCCFSAFKATTYNNGTKVITFDPAQPAWMSKNPIAFYGYEAAQNGVSYIADNNFCVENEDTLIHSFFYFGDSTGNAHLFNGTTIHEQPWNPSLFPYNEGPLLFNQYGKSNWCYGACGEPFTDPRDGQEYKTVCIGDQVWMAENLNWAGAGVCYDNLKANCNTYGRLYGFDEILNGASPSNGVPSGIQGICPNGWHIPSDEEFRILEKYLGATSSDYAKFDTIQYDVIGSSQAVGAKLRDSAHWSSIFLNDDQDVVNQSGFSARPGGEIYLESGTSYSLGYIGNFWTASVYQGTSKPIARLIGNDTDNDVTFWAIHASLDKDKRKYSCRCVKD